MSDHYRLKKGDEIHKQESFTIMNMIITYKIEKINLKRVN